MITTIWGVVRDGRVELSTDVRLTEGARVLVTALPSNDDREFWLHVSETALHDVWDNEQDDVYAQLLTK